jgi:hypothetical protein
MSHINAKITALRELIDTIKFAETVIDRSALFSAMRLLCDDLHTDKDVNGYAQGKAFDVRWHAGAALGFDETNGHSSEQHLVWAMGALNVLESEIGQAL